MGGFLQGATLLALGGLLSRLLGLYRLLLPSLLGPEGVGLYHMAYPIYAATLAVSTGGLPVAISKMVADAAARGAHKEARRVLTVSLVLLSGLGLLGGITLYFMSPWLAQHVTRDARAALSIAAVAPAVLLVAGMSALRGFYQGYQIMWPTALSQVVEQVVRVGALIALVVLLRPQGIAAQAAGAASGASFGALAGLLALFAVRRTVRLPRTGGNPSSLKPLLRTLLVLAVPITVAGLGVPLMQLVDLVLVPARLAALGLGESTRTGLYGELSGYGMPLVALPGIISGAIAVALVPSVAAYASSGNRAGAAKAMRDALRATILWTLPAAVGLYILATPLTRALFDSASAGSIVQALAPSVLFFALAQVSSAGLQGAGETWLPLRNLGYAVLCKIGLTWLLVGQIGVTGAGLATVGAYFVWALLNVGALRRLGRVFSLKEQIARPIVATLLMAAVLAALPLGASRIRAVLAVVVGLAAYFAGLIVAGGLRGSDLEDIPMVGPRLRRGLEWLGLLRR
ncbi:MAG: polysaccharide biosynthesis protein [Thermaerobacter sp.]|nr:polysaccharide biosynthesis protein [Thermaerobacter sp.]